MSDSVFLTHPTLPDNDPVELQAGSSVVTILKARGWEETPAPQPVDPQLRPDTPSGLPHGNASRDEWTTYAELIGVLVSDGMTRDDIKDAVEDHLTNPGDQPTPEQES